jgi:hypothetical protein
VKTRLEIFPGFGLKELAIVLVAAVFGLAIALVLFFFTNGIYWFLLVIPFGFGGFMIGKPIARTGRSGLDLVRDTRNYRSKPNTYYYRFGDGRRN